ncbi:MAG TPA: CPBP family intramembrane metalloprotease [Chitinophagaceae bacterium]|nr:CPBP family intramembrane metalloprotease [Chitinophagaceae bacterium]
MAVFKIGFLLVALVTGRLQGWKGLEGFGLGWRMGWWQQLLKGLLLGFLFFGLAEGLSVAFGYEKFNGIAATEVILKQLPLILLMTFFPSIAEDLLTRGYLYGHLFSKMKPWHWVLLSAVVYVLNHIWRLTENPSVLVYLFILGLVLAFTVWETRALWLALGIHWGANIAFESTHSILQTESAVSNYGSTWILAVVWLLLFLVLLLGRTGSPALRKV